MNRKRFFLQAQQQVKQAGQQPPLQQQPQQQQQPAAGGQQQNGAAAEQVEKLQHELDRMQAELESKGQENMRLTQVIEKSREKNEFHINNS